MGKAHILIVDDEAAIRLFLSEELTQAGYCVHTAASGEEALVQLRSESIDLVLLDLKMGGMDGLQVMEEIERHPLSPVIIILTAYASLESAVGAMRRGGHDYLTKPCRTEELLASVEKGLARRREAVQREQMIRTIEETAQRLRGQLPLAAAASVRPRYLEGRGLLLDRRRKTVSRRGQPLPLTPTEFELLASLMEQVDRPVSYRELAIALHGSTGGEWQEWEARQNLGTHMWRLRRKLGCDPQGEPYIINIRGQGYQFVSRPSVHPEPSRD